MGTLTVHTLRLLVSASLLLALAGCTAWPPPGRGGTAERGRATLPAGTGPALASRLSCALGRFDQARQGAERAGVLTGRVEAAGELATRAQREVHGGLTLDAALTLDRLEAETVALQVLLPQPPPAPPAACA